jgi:hypothetical protein
MMDLFVIILVILLVLILGIENPLHVEAARIKVRNRR